MSRSIAPEALKQLLEAKVRLTILDLWRKSDYDADNEGVPRARWLDHEKFEDWSKALPREQGVVLYCAHGETISTATLDVVRLFFWFVSARGCHETHCYRSTYEHDRYQHVRRN